MQISAIIIKRLKGRIQSLILNVSNTLHYVFEVSPKSTWKKLNEKKMEAIGSR